MYKVYFYKDKNGKQPVLEYLRELSSKTDKNSRIKANKIRSYIKILSQCGTKVGEPYVKHIEGKIWELRPIRDRILFVAFIDGVYVLLHIFSKQTQKTPFKEIERAKKNLKDLIERGDTYE